MIVSNSEEAFWYKVCFIIGLTVERLAIPEWLKITFLQLYLARANDLLLLVIYQNKQLTVYA